MPEVKGLCSGIPLSASFTISSLCHFLGKFFNILSPRFLICKQGGSDSSWKLLESLALTERSTVLAPVTLYGYAFTSNNRDNTEP